MIIGNMILQTAQTKWAVFCFHYNYCDLLQLLSNISLDLFH